MKYHHLFIVSSVILALSTTTCQSEYDDFNGDPLLWIDDEWDSSDTNDTNTTTESEYDWENFTLSPPQTTTSSETNDSTAEFIEWLASRLILPVPDDDDSNNRTSSFFGGFFQFNFDKNINTSSSISSSFEYVFTSSLHISSSQCHAIHSITSALDSALRRANPGASSIQSRPKRVDQQPCNNNVTSSPCPCPTGKLPPHGRRMLSVVLELETVSSSSTLSLPVVMPLGISFSSEKAVRRLASRDSAGLLHTD